ncbi:heavy metal-associated isoprenylated plant protein 6-like isoform X1 [Hibiscus syriacus]|uniref:heavy metal-associated isoprenylated plant protein 6-like isoform X1 n=1 Tax=Hibiscus syriacus TaxID=106335 RepID=UPI001920DD8D|nr:heavy metal-associated isoprenylated plant protein 6-like isoform X1 [Hibiscus syriacus]
MAEKVTTMVLKVDLQCFKCYKKVKKVLCKFPQIRDQIYDEKANTVTIAVICCSPEKIRDKICYKGGGSIKSIEIKPPAKPKEPEKPKEAEKKPEKPKEAEKKPEQPKEAEKKSEKPKEAEKKPEKPKEAEKKPEKPKEAEKKPEKPKESGEKKADKPKEAEKPKEGGEKPKEAAPAAPPKAVEAAPLPAAAYALGYSYMDGYHHGWGGGVPSYYGGPPQQPFQNYETIGRPVYDSWGSGGGYYRYGYGGGRTGECFSDENAQGCSIM